MPTLPSSCGQHPHLSAQHDRATGKRFDATHLARDCEGRNGLARRSDDRTTGETTAGQQLGNSWATAGQRLGNGEAYDFEFTPSEPGDILFTVRSGAGDLLAALPIRVR